MLILRSKYSLSTVRTFSTISRRNVNSVKANYKPKSNKPDQANSWDHVYGISSVLGALHSKKRSVMDTLYIQQSEEKKTTQKKDDQLMLEIVQLAKTQDINIASVDKGKLNTLTDNKPHQGIVLKSTTRSSIEISELSKIHDTTYDIIPKVNKRGSEEDRKKNQDITAIKMNTPKSGRMPFWIALDEVQDPQNLGSILRTAHFFGVDGVLLCSKNSAPLSPTVSKVSSGAVEVMDIYSTTNLVKFLKGSNANGWEVVGAAGDAAPSINTLELAGICKKPVILVLGNEGTGLRTNIKNACNLFVSIPQAVNENVFNGSVDSLNVGVAAGVLISSALSQN